MRLSSRIVAMTLLASVSSTAAEATVRPAGQSLTVCQATTPPAGWVETAYFDWYTCGTPGSFMYNAKTITDVHDTAPGRSVTACITPPPAGFYATSLSYSFSCEIAKRSSGILNNQHQITNLNGLRSGSTIVICGIQPAPAGWAVVGVVEAYQCIYPRSGSLGQNAMTIRKL